MAKVNLNQWATLHYDLLDQIAKQVDYGDYVRLRAVCKEWNFELPKIPKHIKNPWLVQPFEEGQNQSNLRPSYSVVDDRIYHFDLSAFQNPVICGSCFGWLILVGLKGSVRMFNPFTKAQVDLPPLSTFPDIIDYQPKNHGREYTIQSEKHGIIYTVDNTHMQAGYIEKIIISSPPDNVDSDFMAIAIYGEYTWLAYCRLGDCKWTKVTRREDEYQDAVFHEGKIYTIDYGAYVYEFDTKSKASTVEEISQAAPPADLIIGYANLHNKYVVGIPDGLLMVIRRLEPYTHHKILNGEETKPCYRTSGFEIYKMNNFSKESVWSRVYDLGGYVLVLVLGLNSSICLLPDTFPDGKGNHFCYTDNMMQAQYLRVIGVRDIGVFDLEDGTTKQLFFDSDLIFPAPVWALNRIFSVDLVVEPFVLSGIIIIKQILNFLSVLGHCETNSFFNRYRFIAKTQNIMAKLFAFVSLYKFELSTSS